MDVILNNCLIMDFSELVVRETTGQQLIRAVNEQNFTRLRELLTLDVRIQDVKDSDDDTLLHLAVRNENVEILEYILNFDVTDIIDAYNDFGRTALLMAAYQTSLDATKLLIKKGASVNLCDPEGNTPLHYAAFYECRETCLLLLENGANVNARNNEGDTALHLVCGCHTDLELVAMLTCFGAHVNIPSYDAAIGGNTPFETSLRDKKIEFSKFLFDYAIDGLDKLIVPLEALMGAMEHFSEIFPMIIDHISDVIFEDCDIYSFLGKIFYFKSEFLRMFLKRFDYVMKGVRDVDNQVTTSLNKYMTEDFFDQQQAVENLFMIFKPPFISYFIGNVRKVSNLFISLMRMYRYHKLSLSSFTGIIFHFLSYGADIPANILEDIYFSIGDGEMFRTLLHMDVQFNSYAELAPFPGIIYNTDLKNVENYFESFFCDDVIASRMMLFFGGAKFKSYNMLGLLSDGMIEKIKRLPDVPSLRELSRNVARNYIIDFYNVKNCRQFYTIVKVLPISNVYKAMISFQKELYQV